MNGNWYCCYVKFVSNGYLVVGISYDVLLNFVDFGFLKGWLLMFVGYFLYCSF